MKTPQRGVLGKIGRLVEGAESRVIKIKRVAQVIRKAGGYRWVGI